MESISKGRYLRISPMKVRKVVKYVKELSLNDTIAYLKILPNKGARLLLKVINSAIANFKNKYPEADIKNLKIKKILVDQAPVMRRIMPRARGRADVLRKQSCHITVVLTNE